ncbi:MAG TPA: hypothetical protein VH062_24720 [Polyangiaceae bacterium]|nr:hypothetical protein [Polyangiaceae bacterium]
MRTPRAEQGVPRPSYGNDVPDSGEVSVPTAVTVRRHAVETSALVESEKLLAQTNRSGVRTIAPEVRAITEGFDPSNAVTKVHRAVQLDEFLPPTVEVTVVVNEIIAVGRPASLASRPIAVLPTPLDVVATAPAVTTVAVEDPPQRRASSSARRAIAALVAASVMAGACALLVVAVRRGRVSVPEPVARAFAPLLQLFHHAPGGRPAPNTVQLFRER